MLSPTQLVHYRCPDGRRTSRTVEITRPNATVSNHFVNCVGNVTGCLVLSDVLEDQDNGQDLTDRVGDAATGDI